MRRTRFKRERTVPTGMPWATRSARTSDRPTRTAAACRGRERRARRSAVPARAARPRHPLGMPTASIAPSVAWLAPLGGASKARHCAASLPRCLLIRREAMPSSHGLAESHVASKSRRRRNATRNVSLRTSSAASWPTRRAANAPITRACRSKSSANADGCSIDRRMISLSVLTSGIARSATSFSSLPIPCRTGTAT